MYYHIINIFKGGSKVTTNYYVVHGSFGNPFGNWFPWLKSKLAERDLECIVPYFLSPKHQTYENWEGLLNYYKHLGEIGEKTIFVAHSLGCVFVAKYILENKIKVKGFISVSGFNNFLSGDEDFDNINSPFFVENSKLEKLSNYCPIRHSFISDNDPYLPQDVLKRFANTINAESYVVHNGGHINAESGYVEFPALLNVLLSK